MRDGAHELVLHAVELAEALVLLGEPARRLVLARDQLLAFECERELGGDGFEGAAPPQELDVRRLHHQMRANLTTDRNRQRERLVVGGRSGSDDGLPVRHELRGGSLGDRVQVFARVGAEQLGDVSAEHALPLGGTPRQEGHVAEADHQQAGEEAGRDQRGDEVQRLVADVLNDHDHGASMPAPATTARWRPSCAS